MPVFTVNACAFMMTVCANIILNDNIVCYIACSYAYLMVSVIVWTSSRNLNNFCCFIASTTTSYRRIRLHICSKGKVRQRPSHQHHRCNEHNKHSFPELHKSKILSAQNLCAHLSGLRLTDVFSSGFSKSAAECTAVPVGFYPCACLRFSNCRDSSVSPRLSDSHAPHIGSFLKYAGIISSILRRLCPVSVVWFASGHSIP